MANVTLRNGLRLGGWYCPTCDAHSDGMVYRDRFRWQCRMDCGHEKNLGDTLPAEELERRGILNANDGTTDPRLVAKWQRLYEERMLIEFDKIYRLLKGVSHWMDKVGGVHNNPLFGMSRSQIDAHKKLKMNMDEIKIIYEGILRLLDYKKKRDILRANEEQLSQIAQSGKKVRRAKQKILSSDGREFDATVTVESQ